jgi:hypothetical protein
MRARTRGSKRCVGTSRRCLPRRRSKRGRRASGRSPKTALPLIGAVPGVEGAYVATGHSVRGMLNAPATGEAMSELILDGAARHVDLAPFAPERLPPLDPARLRDLKEARVLPIERPPAFDGHVARSGKRVAVIKVPSRSTCHLISPRSFRDPALTGRRAPPRGSRSFAGVVVDRRNGLRSRQTGGSPPPLAVRRIANQRAVLGAARGALRSGGQGANVVPACSGKCRVIDADRRLLEFAAELGRDRLNSSSCFCGS